MKTFKKIMLLLLIFVMVISMISCGKKENPSGNQNVSYEFTEVFENGSTEFVFGVVDLNGNESYFDIKTDKETVGEALLEIGLIDGDDSDYGLYVKTVNGITLDYDKDGKYWAFYIDNEYATTSVDLTNISEGTLYEFKAE